MNRKTARIIIFGLMGIMAVKLCCDFGCYVYDNIHHIRAEKEYAEYKEQEKRNIEEYQLRQTIREEVRRQNRYRYY